MLLDGALGQEQRLRDRGVVLSLGHVAEDLALPVGQLRERGMRHALLRCDERLDDLRVEHAAALRHLGERAHELLDVGDALLQQVAEAGRAVLQQVVGVLLLRELREHDHADVRVGRPDPLRGADALVGVARRHPDVGEDGVGLRARRPRTAALRGSAAMPTSSTSVCGRQERSGPLPHEVVILGEDHAHGMRGWYTRELAEVSGGGCVTIRVVLGEDNVLVREGVRALLNSYEDIEVVGVAEDAPSLLATAAEHVPDVVVTDIKMPPNFQLEGIDCAHAIREKHPDTGVVVLSAHDDEAYAIALLGKGHSGLAYLLKDRIAQGDELVRAIREVAPGRERGRPRDRRTSVGPARDRGARPRAPRPDGAGPRVRGDGRRLGTTQEAVDRRVTELFTTMAGARRRHAARSRS